MAIAKIKIEKLNTRNQVNTQQQQKQRKNVTTNRQKVVKMPKTHREWSHVSPTFKLLRWDVYAHICTNTCTRKCKWSLIKSPSKYTYPYKDPTRGSWMKHSNINGMCAAPLVKFELLAPLRQCCIFLGWELYPHWQSCVTFMLH